MSRAVSLDALFAPAPDADADVYPRTAGPHAAAPVLFGAGRLGQKIATRLRGTAIRPVAFADNAPERWGTTVAGLPVLPPDEAARAFGATHPAVVTIWSPGHRYPDTAAQLAGLGWRRVLPWMVLAWAEPEALLPHFFYAPPAYYREREDDIRAAYALLGDDVSRREFVGQLAWRLTADFGALQPPALGTQYVEPELLAPHAAEHFVDVGAYDGDTLDLLVKWTDASFARVDAFEPDPGNYERLVAAVAAMPDAVRARVVTHRAAVGAAAGEARFSAEGQTSSALSAEGDVTVPVVALDDVLAGGAPTYLKFDIEGGEGAALTGAATTIDRHAPVLAVSTEHLPDDLWRLPLQVAASGLPYRHALRGHMADGFESVWYAIPPARSRSGG
jgi:FkbM family methyltransferase